MKKLLGLILLSLSLGAQAQTTVQLRNIAAQATNTIVGNATSGSASPTALAISSCSGASNALIWTTNTGFGCNTITASGLTLASSTMTGFTDKFIPYNNAGVVGQYGISGTGTTIPTTASPTFTGTVGAAAITASGQIGAASSSSTPTISFSSGANYGWAYNTGAIDTWINGTNTQAIFGGGLTRNASGVIFGWSSGTPHGAANDIALSRVSAGVLGVGSGGAAGIDGSLNLTNLTASGTIKTGGYTVATLPAGSAGMRAYVTDQLTTCAAIGVAPTGGGAVICPVFYAASWVSG